MMMDRNLRTRLQAARWLLKRVASKEPEEREAFLRSETDDQLLIDLVEGLLENESSSNSKNHENLITEIEMGNLDAVDLLREINGVPRRLGDFDLSRPVGRGGMGSVYLAEHRSTGVRHALKVAVGDTIDADSIRSLLMEAEIMQTLGALEGIPASLPAKTIVREDQAIAYYGRDFIRGTGIDDWITAASPDIHRILELSVQSCRILESCHRVGVIHGDVKPSNILVGHDGNSVSLIDFGLSVRIRAGERLNRNPVGHLAFTAPEVRSAESYDPRLADQFSMGITIYSLIQKANPTGFNRLPGEASRIAEGIPGSDLPDPIRTVLCRMTSIEPAERFTSMESASAALAQVVERLPSGPASSGSVRRVGKSAAVALGLACLVFSAGMIGWFLRSAPVVPPVTVDAPSFGGDLKVVMSALDGGDVALASQVLGLMPRDDDSWLARHLRSRIRSIYDGALVEQGSIPSADSSERYEMLRRGEVMFTRDMETGQIRHRWPAEPTWSVQGVHQDGASVVTSTEVLELDLRRAAAAMVVARDAVAGTLFSAGEDQVGWLTQSGSIVIHRSDWESDSRLQLPDGLDVERTSIASDGWARMVLVDGSDTVRVLGLGPRLGMQSTVSLEAAAAPHRVLSLSGGAFLLHGESRGCWILTTDNTVREIPMKATIRHACASVDGGAHLLLQQGESSELVRMLPNGEILEPTRRFAGTRDAIFESGGSEVYLLGPSGVEIASDGQTSFETLDLGSLREVSSLHQAGPRCLLLGGRWSGLWVMDPTANVLFGHIDTGGDEVRSIIGTSGQGTVYTQDESGFVRRIPS